MSTTWSRGSCACSTARPSQTRIWNGAAPDPATGAAPYRVYNIGNDRPEELNDLIALIEDALGRKANASRRGLCRPATCSKPAPTSRTCGATSASRRLRHSPRACAASSTGIAPTTQPERSSRLAPQEAIKLAHAPCRAPRLGPVVGGAHRPPEAAPEALCAGASECPLEPPDADAAGRRHRGRFGGAPRRRQRHLPLRTAPFRELPIVAAAALLLALVGAVDDIRPLPAAPRLLLQIIAVATVVLASDLRVLSGAFPHGSSKTILILAGVWFVNLVNFMDGLDWITVAEIVPVTAFLALLGPAGILPGPVALVAAALCGALLGFAPFNKPSRGSSSATSARCRSALSSAGSLLQLAGARAARGGRPAPALLSRRRDDHAAAPPFPRRAGLGGASQPLLPAGDRQRLFGDRGEQPRVRPQRRPWLCAGATLLWPRPEIEVAALLVGIAAVATTLVRFSRRRNRVGLEASR